MTNQKELLQQCLASGQMSAAQHYQHQQANEMTTPTSEVLAIAIDALQEMKYCNDTDVAKRKYEKAMSLLTGLQYQTTPLRWFTPLGRLPVLQYFNEAGGWCKVPFVTETDVYH